mgnify:CR=1 FL=1
MNHLGMSVAPTSLTKALDSVGKDFDVEEKISCHLSREMETKKEVEILNQKLTESEATKGKDHVGIEKAALDQKVEELNTLYTKHRPYFDLRVEAAGMTSDNQTKDLHQMNHNAILNRV